MPPASTGSGWRTRRRRCAVPKDDRALDYFLDRNAGATSGAKGSLLVVSHMRSHSSLLAHILGSNPGIAGYSELHMSYLGRIDLRRLQRRVEDTTGSPAAGRITLDKLLHDRFEIAQSVFEREDVRVLFLLRHPDQTIGSLLRLGRLTPAIPWYSDPQVVAEYYCTRLATLERYCRFGAGRAAFVASERLMADTVDVLSALTRWLGLNEPLTAHYRTFRFTGVPGHGDPSESIRAGTVISPVEPPLPAAVAIPEDAARACRAAWDRCRTTLAAHCAVM
jgi:hypothetical protein